MMIDKQPLTKHSIAIICGGPSKERGISLNSARSFLDHTLPLEIHLSLFYLHPSGLFYELSNTELYSNTPSDFDFKLAHTKRGLSEEEFLTRLSSMDLVFPLIHGTYGEDGTLQTLLEMHHIPFVGSSSSACRSMFHKYQAHQKLKKHDFPTIPTLYIDSRATSIKTFWQEQSLKRAILKPATSGSSIGVTIVHTPEDAAQAIQHLWEEGFHELLLEHYREGREFTLCVLTHLQSPVALIPLEIDVREQGIFDYRKKYLPSLETRYYCPARFSQDTIALIRKEAERLFQLFQIRDCARIDGWVTKEGSIHFSDFNPISGMEQNSFLFQQASRIGLSHTDVLEHIMNQALIRYNKSPLYRKTQSTKEKKSIYVLMGGNTSERQVSLLSGTNVWLKLLQSTSYKPTPFLFDTEGAIWELPYDFTLHHTVEEMAQHCQRASELIEETIPFVSLIRKHLDLPPLSEKHRPIKMDLSAFIQKAKKENSFVFLALHGGKGEDGSLQKQLEKKGIFFNGSKSITSQLCMDKYQTAQAIRALQHPHILPMPQISFRLKQATKTLWQRAIKTLQTTDLIIKPQKDGCSTGVVRLSQVEEFLQYLKLYKDKQPRAHAGYFVHHASPIEMPNDQQTWFLLEPFIQTDAVYVVGTQLHYKKISGWCEMTIGILERQGTYRALNPSLTLALNHVLSLEEKFQGGTGINITPPPESILSKTAKELVQKSACEVGKILGIRGYARLDLFVECSTGVIRVIEANTLPALSPSTVLYHQALAEASPMTPQELLIELIESS